MKSRREHVRCWCADRHPLIFIDPSRGGQGQDREKTATLPWSSSRGGMHLRADSGQCMASSRGGDLGGSRRTAGWVADYEPEGLGSSALPVGFGTNSRNAMAFSDVSVSLTWA